MLISYTTYHHNKTSKLMIRRPRHSSCDDINPKRMKFDLDSASSSEEEDSEEEDSEEEDSEEEDSEEEEEDSEEEDKDESDKRHLTYVDVLEISMRKYGYMNARRWFNLVYKENLIVISTIHQIFVTFFGWDRIVAIQDKNQTKWKINCIKTDRIITREDGLDLNNCIIFYDNDLIYKGAVILDQVHGFSALGQGEMTLGGVPISQGNYVCNSFVGRVGRKLPYKHSQLLKLSVISLKKSTSLRLNWLPKTDPIWDQCLKMDLLSLKESFFTKEQDKDNFKHVLDSMTYETAARKIRKLGFYKVTGIFLPESFNDLESCDDVSASTSLRCPNLCRDTLLSFVNR